jgi:hypothetical protein
MSKQNWESLTENDFREPSGDDVERNENSIVHNETKMDQSTKIALHGEIKGPASSYYAELMRIYQTLAAIQSHSSLDMEIHPDNQCVVKQFS